jgi:hypothetical protein
MPVGGMAGLGYGVTKNRLSKGGATLLANEKEDKPSHLP